MTRVRSAFGIALVAAAFAAGVANADVVASFTYDDLSGGYDGAGNFQARAVNNAQLQTSGDTSRLVPTMGNATFAPGFVSRSAANAIININVSNVRRNMANDGFEADGAGGFAFTDVDGTFASGGISGTWSKLDISPFIFFDGALGGVGFSGLSWDGEAGQWNTDMPGGPPYDGAIVQLTFGGNFFQSAFSGVATGSTLQLTPTPGPLALLGLAGLAAARRRRA